MPILIWVALLLGASAAAAALWGYYRELPGWLTGPEVCQLEAGGCAVLFRTPRAALLGIPNASLGMVLYVLLAAGLLAGLAGVAAVRPDAAGRGDERRSSAGA